MAKKKQNIEENNKAVTNRDQLSEPVANCDQFVVNEPTFSQSDIEKMIVTVRGVQVMIDCDLAHVYSVTTSQLNQQVKRNIARFPNNFRAVRLHDVGAGPVPARCPHKGHIHLPLSPSTFALKGNRAGTGPAPTLVDFKRTGRKILRAVQLPDVGAAPCQPDAPTRGTYICHYPLQHLP